jgi:predicted nucleic acid-binding protein
MMVLVDTSVWVEHLRSNEPRLAGLLTRNQVLSHPFVRGELALGNLRQRDLILSALDNLPQAPVAFADEVNFFIELHSLFWFRYWADRRAFVSGYATHGQCQTLDAQ